MYWHGAQEDTRRTVNKIIADRAMGILPTCSFGSGTSHSGFTRFNPVELGRGAVDPLNRG